MGSTRARANPHNQSGGGGLTQSRDIILPVRITLHEFTDEEALSEPKEDPETARRRGEIRAKYSTRSELAVMCHRALNEYVEGEGCDRHPARNEQIEDVLIDIISRIDEKTEETKKVLTSNFRGY